MFGVTTQIFVESSHLRSVLSRLEMKLSHPGLELFLRGTTVPWLKQRVEQRFASHGDDASGRWPRLSPATVHIRQTMGYSPFGPINVRTKQMKTFATGSFGDVTNRGSSTVLTYPSTRNYSSVLMQKVATAQAGRTKPNTPPRPIFAIGTEDDLFVTSELTAYLLGEV